MKRYTFIVLIFACLWSCGSMCAQSFMPSDTYQGIQIESYAADGLHLESAKYMRKAKLYFDPQHSLSIFDIGVVQLMSDKDAPILFSGQYRARKNGVWKSTITSVGGDISEVQIAKRRAIGNDDVPSNPPVPTPIGDTYIFIIFLLTMYMCVFPFRRVS